MRTDLVVLGGGPGGYTAAFLAADKGKRVVLVERESRLGGVCLNHGCIPSKALLYIAKLIREAEGSKSRGVVFGAPRIDLNALRLWKDSILDRLSAGIRQLGERRGVEIVTGRGSFEGSNILKVETAGEEKRIKYDKAIIAVGSRPALPKEFDAGDPRVMTSTEALQIEAVFGDFLIVGGGYVGLEIGTIYASLGSRVVLVEAMNSLLPGVDPDLVRPVDRFAKDHFREVHLNTEVKKIAPSGPKIEVWLQRDNQTFQELYDRVLIAVGRVSGCGDLGLENTKVTRGEGGFVEVNERQETTDPSVYAIGDVVGGPFLAHKASWEARLAVNSMMGEGGTSGSVVIPSVVFTDPEVAWCGLTEVEARQKGIESKVVRFPWSASGKAVTLGKTDGLTKLVIEKHTERVIGVGITGCGASELISEGVVAIKMGAKAKDIAESVHPHPTLSETLMESAGMFCGAATHVIGRADLKSRSAPRSV